MYVPQTAFNFHKARERRTPRRRPDRVAARHSSLPLPGSGGGAAKPGVNGRGMDLPGSRGDRIPEQPAAAAQPRIQLACD